MNIQRMLVLMVIGLAVMALATLVVGGKSASGSWQTYTDKEQGYKFSYPKGWFLETGNPNQLANYDMEKGAQREFDPNFDKDKVKIEIYSTAEPYESVDKFLEKQEGKETMYQRPQPTYALFIIDNKEAVKTVEQRLGGILSIFVQNPQTNKIHSISVINYNSNQDIVDGIIATFKFAS